MRNLSPVTIIKQHDSISGFIFGVQWQLSSIIHSLLKLDSIFLSTYTSSTTTGTVTALFYYSLSSQTGFHFLINLYFLYNWYSYSSLLLSTPSANWIPFSYQLILPLQLQGQRVDKSWFFCINLIFNWFWLISVDFI